MEKLVAEQRKETKRQFINAKYKDSVFRMAFEEKKYQLELYNALNGSDYDDPEAVEVTTLEDTFFIGMRNDLSFVVGLSLNMYEHQSTKNLNMPLRGLIYFTQVYMEYINRNGYRLYAESQIPLPFPKYIVFYNGEKDAPDEEELLLSDAFPKEMIDRSTNNPTLQDIDFSKIEKRHKANQEYKRKQKQTKYDKKSVHIKSFKIYEKIKVILTKAERKEINILVDKMYKDKLISRKDNVFKYKRILAMLIYLSRKCEKTSTELRALKNDGHFVKDTDGQNVKYLRTIYIQKWIKKYDNVPDELTDLALEKLTGVNHKMIETVIKHLEKVGVIQTRINPDGALYLKVLPWHYDGEVWMEEIDYNKAGTMIRDYFRSRIP